MTCPAAGIRRARAVDDLNGVKMNFWKMYHRYYGPVRKFIMVYVRDEWAADDLIQETFMRVQKNLGSVRDPSKMSSWIFRIAYNLCHDHFRQSRKSPLNEGAIQEKVEPFGEAPVQKELEQRQMGQCVQDKMDLLPPDFRTVLILSDVMAFSHKEIVEILGISVSNVKVRVHRARRKLRAILEDHCTFEVDERNVLVCDPREEEQ